MKRTLTATSIAALLFVLPAYAQLAPADKTAPPMDRNATDTAKPGLPMRGSGASTAAQSHQGEWRASQLIGASVYSDNNESIGEIKDLVIDGEGKVATAVVGIGGFLGMGERNVALPFDRLAFDRDANNNIRISGSFTKDSLKSMPEWKASDMDKNDRKAPQ